jgi:hypothetical protein
MDENIDSSVSAPPAVVTVPDTKKQDGNGTDPRIWIAVAIIVLLFVLFLLGLFLLIQAPVTVTSHWADIFIIFMALESLVIGLALVVLIIQLAILINLLQNEVQPILNSTNETVNTLKGTANFLSENLTQPVIEMNAYLAAMKKFFDLLRPGGSRR